MMMVGIRHLAEFAQIQKARKLVKMEHRFVFTMFAIKRYIFPQIHILKIIRNKAAVTALHALAEFFYYFFTVFRHIVIVYETEKKCKKT